MPCHRVYLWSVCLLVVLLLLMLQVDAQRNRRNGNKLQQRSSSQAQSRIVSTGSNRRRGGNSRARSSTKATARIVSGNSGSSGNSRRRRGNRNRNSANRRANRRANNRKGNSSPSRSSRASVASRIVSGSSSSSGVQARIVGGGATSISTMPYLVQVHIGSSGLCGGTLIDPLWILTAAHCVKDVVIKTIRVIAGATKLYGSRGQSRSVAKSIVAPKFTFKVMNWDVALLKLNASMTLGSNVSTIALATTLPAVGTVLRIGGWGAIKEGGTAVKHLQSTEVELYNKKKCKRDYKGEAKLTGTMICAEGEHKDSCTGDSGGGLYYADTVLGIVSFGYGCARAKYPGVYTSVPKVASWVNETMAAN